MVQLNLSRSNVEWEGMLDQPAMWLATWIAPCLASTICTHGLCISALLCVFHAISNSPFSIDFPAWCFLPSPEGPVQQDIFIVFNVFFFLLILRWFMGQDCSTKSPDYGPLPPGAPNWCKAPFDPEGLLRWGLASVRISLVCTLLKYRCACLLS